MGEAGGGYREGAHGYDIEAEDFTAPQVLSLTSAAAATNKLRRPCFGLDYRERGLRGVGGGGVGVRPGWGREGVGGGR